MIGRDRTASSVMRLVFRPHARWPVAIFLLTYPTGPTDLGTQPNQTRYRSSKLESSGRPTMV